MSPVILTQSEIKHLLTLIYRNYDDGIHTAPSGKYWKKTRTIEAKLRAGYDSSKQHEPKLKPV